MAQKKLTRGERVIAFIEKYCKTPEGQKIGQPLKLDAFQKKFILDVYDNPYGTHSAYLSIARKNGKTGLIAALLLAHLVGPEAVQNSQIVSGAQSKDQAAVVFELARKHPPAVAFPKLIRPCHQTYRRFDPSQMERSCSSAHHDREDFRSPLSPIDQTGGFG